MKIHINPTKEENGRAAAGRAAALMKDILVRKEKLRFIAATGASQFEFLEHLCATEGIDWSRTEMFHLDEYVGIPDTHPASFVGYLKERLVAKVNPGTVHFVRGDAPADFETQEPYLVLNLDERCRKQQVGEGWFGSLDEVPPQAYTMSIRQIMKTEQIICTVPDERKAEAVKNCLGPDAEITPNRPASILKKHAACDVFLDKASASLLENPGG